MNTNIPPSQKIGVVGAVGPSVGQAALSTGWIKSTDFHQFMAIIQAGTLGVSATFDAKLEQAIDNAGTDAKDVTGKAISQLTQAGDDDSDSQVVVNLRTEELDHDAGFVFFRLTVTPAVADSGAAGVVLGVEPRYTPASDFDAASVAEIVA